MGLNLFQPTVDISKRHRTINRICQYNPRRALIIRLRYGPEPFLPGRIPYLQLDFGPVNIEHLDLKINPDCGYITLSELSLTKCRQEIGLTHTAVSDYYYLENFYLLLIFFRHFIFF